MARNQGIYNKAGVFCSRLNPYRGKAVKITLNKTLAALGLEEPQNFQELLTESVGHVHFSGLIMFASEFLTRFVVPLIFSAKVNCGVLIVALIVGINRFSAE